MQKECVKVELVSLSKIKPYKKNNRKHPKNQVDKLAKQIEAHGFDQPIVVDKDFVIIKGHCRALSAKQLGLKVVPVVVRDDLTPEQCNAARIADNKLSELAEIDVEALQLELDTLKAIDFDLDLTAFDSWNAEEIKEETKQEKNMESSIANELVLILTFDNETDQQMMYNEMMSRNIDVRIP